MPSWIHSFHQHLLLDTTFQVPVRAESSYEHKVEEEEEEVEVDTNCSGPRRDLLLGLLALHLHGFLAQVVPNLHPG